MDGYQIKQWQNEVEFQARMARERFNHDLEQLELSLAARLEAFQKRIDAQDAALMELGIK